MFYSFLAGDLVLRVRS